MSQFFLKKFILAVSFSCLILNGCSSGSAPSQSPPPQKDFPTPYSHGPTSDPSSMKGPNGPPPDSSTSQTFQGSTGASAQFTTEKDDVHLMLPQKSDAGNGLKTSQVFETAEIQPLKLSFQYPRVWGDTTSSTEAGRTTISFTQPSFQDKVVFVYDKKSSIPAGNLILEEELAPDRPVSCDALKKDPQKLFVRIDQCQSFSQGPHTFLVFHLPESEYDQERYSALYYTGNKDYPYVIFYALKKKVDIGMEDFKNMAFSIKET